MPKSHFIFKKAQENFERVTFRRLIQIKDGHPETVYLWLAYLRKHQFYGIGMKANVWEFELPDISSPTKTDSNSLMDVDKTWSRLGQMSKLGAYDRVEHLLNSRRFKEATGLRLP